MSNEKRQTKTGKLTLMALFIAIVVILGATPIGIIPIGPIGLTTVHIPVIIGTLVLGVTSGMFLGFIFGLVSFFVATYAPFVGAFVFSPFAPGIPGYTGNFLSLVVCFVPRILIAVTTAFVFLILRKITKSPAITYGVSALVGSLTNTVLVLGFIYLFFGEGYAQAVDIAYPALLTAILSVVVTQGIPEAIAAVIVAIALGKVIDYSRRSAENRRLKREQAADTAASKYDKRHATVHAPVASSPSPVAPAESGAPLPTEPAPPEPAPLEPAPLEPAPLEPAPLEPAPLEPAPLEPAPQAESEPLTSESTKTAQTNPADASPEGRV